MPAGADTVVRVDGDTIRADIGDTSGVAGGGATWRVTFTAGQMTSLAKLSGGRVRERVTRDLRQARVQYENMDARRSLTLTQVRSDTVPEFDPDVWQH